MSSTDYSKTAEFYDLVDAAAGRDVAAESAAVAALVRARVAGDRPSVIDAAAGTGAYLLALGRLGFAAAGIETDPTMLQIARSRDIALPVDFAPLATFAAPAPYDAVVVLRGALAAARDAERLGAAVANLAALRAPGGIVVAEPYLSPDVYVVGAIEAIHVDEPRVKISRVVITKRVSNLAILDYHYLIATNRGVERLFARVERGLYAEAAYRKAFEAAGLRFEIVRAPAFPMGLMLGF